MVTAKITRSTVRMAMTAMHNAIAPAGDRNMPPRNGGAAAIGVCPGGGFGIQWRKSKWRGDWTSLPSATISTMVLHTQKRTGSVHAGWQGGLPMGDGRNGLQLRSLVRKSGELELSLVN